VWGENNQSESVRKKAEAPRRGVLGSSLWRQEFGESNQRGWEDRWRGGQGRSLPRKRSESNQQELNLVRRESNPQWEQHESSQCENSQQDLRLVRRENNQCVQWVWLENNQYESSQCERNQSRDGLWHEVQGCRTLW